MQTENKAISRCCFSMTFSLNNGAYAHTAIALAAVAVKFCLIKLPKIEKNRQIINSQTSRKQTKARPNKKTAESAGNISAMKSKHFQ